MFYTVKPLASVVCVGWTRDRTKPWLELGTMRAVTWHRQRVRALAWVECLLRVVHAVQARLRDRRRPPAAGGAPGLQRLRCNPVVDHALDLTTA